MTFGEVDTYDKRKEILNVRSKTYFGCAVIDDEDSEESIVKYPLQLEYYRTENNIQSKSGLAKKEKMVYGVEVIKKDYSNKEAPYVEKYESEYIAKNMEEADKLIKILRDYKVTPVHVDDIISDLKQIIF